MALDEQADMSRYRELIGDGLVTVGTGYALLAVMATVGGVGALLGKLRGLTLDDSARWNVGRGDARSRRAHIASVAVGTARAATTAASS